MKRSKRNVAGHGNYKENIKGSSVPVYGLATLDVWNFAGIVDTKFTRRVYSGSAFVVLNSCLPFHIQSSWWRHQMEIFSALLALCEGNSHVCLLIRYKLSIIPNIYSILQDICMLYGLACNLHWWWSLAVDICDTHSLIGAFVQAKPYIYYLKSNIHIVHWHICIYVHNRQHYQKTVIQDNACKMPSATWRILCSYISSHAAAGRILHQKFCSWHVWSSIVRFIKFYLSVDLQHSNQ